MEKRLNKVLFVFFEFLLLVLFFRMAMFWMYYLVYDESLTTGAMSIIRAIIIALILVLFAFNGKLFFGGVHTICIMWMVGMAISLAISGAKYGLYFLCLFWPLLFESTYLFLREDERRVSHLIWFFVVVAAFGLFFFVQSMFAYGFSIQSNMIYFFELALPFLLLKDNKAWRNVVLILGTVAALASMKRSMMLAIALFWLVLAVKSLLRSGRNRGLVVVYGLLIVGVVYFSFGYVNQLSGGLMTERFEMEDASNGRESLTEETRYLLDLSTTLELWFGHGHDAVRQHSSYEMSAHNEWLEILYDYGIIVLVIYFFFWVYLIKRWLFHYRTNSNYLIAYTLSICVFAVMSMVSELILYVSYFLYLVMFWAAVEAMSSSDYYEYKYTGR